MRVRRHWHGSASSEFLGASQTKNSLDDVFPSSNALGQSAVFGTEALARLGLRLGGFQLMLQSSQFDGVAFDPFSF
jgi:hypothetical protein